MVNKKRVGMMVAVTLLTGVLLFCSVFFLVRRANREITQRSFDELTTATQPDRKGSCRHGERGPDHPLRHGGADRGAGRA